MSNSSEKFRTKTRRDSLSSVRPELVEGPFFPATVHKKDSPSTSSRRTGRERKLSVSLRLRASQNSIPPPAAPSFPVPSANRPPTHRALPPPEPRPAPAPGPSRPPARRPHTTPPPPPPPPPIPSPPPPTP